MTSCRSAMALLAASCLAAWTMASAQGPPAALHLLIVVDGLRPDYVTPEAMSRLSRLASRGVRFSAHHAVVPTVTRVNGSSLVTGAYPETHGVLGNTVYIPSVDALRGLATSDHTRLEAIQQAEGRTITAPTLGEILEQADRTWLAIGSGSSGATWLLNHDEASGAIIHTEFARPAGLAVDVATRFGAPPPEAIPNAAVNARAVDALITFGLGNLEPHAIVIWLSDPDTTAHAKGMGAPETVQSLALVDAEIGRIEDALAAAGRLAHTNIIVTADHGFSTHGGAFDLGALVAPFARRMPDGTPDLVTAEGAVHFRTPPEADRLAAIVAALQKRPEVGAIFTRPRSAAVGGPVEAGAAAEGVVPGTLSFDVVRWHHPRAGEILASANWARGTRVNGFEGSTTASGVAGHGSTSEFDIRATLIAAGPAFKERVTSDVPTGNVDLAPTILRLLGLPIPPSMTGRVIEEALRQGPEPRAVRVERADVTAATPDRSYELTAHLSIVGGHRYLDSTEVRRRVP